MKNGNILPTKILVRQFKAEEKKTTGGLILPGLGKPSQTGGDVILTGEGTSQSPMMVKVGQKVLFSPHAFQTVVIDEEEFALVDVRDILFYFD